MDIQRGMLVLTAAAIAAGLCACQGAGGTFGAFGGSPEGIPVVFESIEGPPAPVKAAFAAELASAAASRKIDLAGADGEARYRLRGYLTTETSADGETSLAFVWDVFDAEKRRAKRLTGSSPIKAAAADRWSGLDKAALAKLAAESADEIAGFLSQSRSEAPTMTASASPTGQPALGFAAP